MNRLTITAASLLLFLGAGCSRYEAAEAPALTPIAPTKTIEQTETPVKTTPAVTTTPIASSTAVVTTTPTQKIAASANLLAENYDEFSSLEIFATSSQAIYFQRQLDGLGGYILFNNSLVPLIRVDRATGEMRQITTKTTFTSPQDVMPDDSLIVYVVAEDARGKGIVTIDPATNLQKFYPITPPAPYTIIGDVRFSPSGKEVAFAMAVSNPDKEQGVVYRMNLETGKTTRVAATKPADNTYYRVLGWTEQDTVIYE